MANVKPKAKQAPTSISEWKWFNQHVTSELKSGEFISAATILLAAGPPSLRDTSEDVVQLPGLGTPEIAYPLGVIENFGLAQNRQLQRMFEIGSKRSYFIPGRTIGSISLGRVLFYGPSILRVLYAYYPTDKETFPNGNVANLLGSGQLESLGVALRDKNGLVTKVNDAPGYGFKTDDGNENSDFWINLASDLFDKPFGLLVMLRDHRNCPYGSFYLEDVNLQAHQFNVNASSVLVAEGVSAQYDKLVPIQISSPT
jgi:hypothetical protein